MRCVSGLGTGVGAVLLAGCEVGGTRRRLCRSLAMPREKRPRIPGRSTPTFVLYISAAHSIDRPEQSNSASRTC
jgi:hypothetical protein